MYNKLNQWILHCIRIEHARFDAETLTFDQFCAVIDDIEFMEGKDHECTKI